MPNYNTALSALGSMSVALQATANNIANVNTNGYKAQRVVLETGPADQGVHVARISRDLSPGPAVMNAIFEVEQRAAGESAAAGYRQRRAMDSVANAYEMEEASRADSAGGLVEQEIRAYESTLASIPKNYVEASNTDLPREFANLHVAEFAYSAAASVIRSQHELTGSILNIVA